jgi:hypothetical protein
MSNGRSATAARFVGALSGPGKASHGPDIPQEECCPAFFDLNTIDGSQLPPTDGMLI